MDIDSLLKQCRFPKRLNGYYPLRECVKIVVEDENRLLNLSSVFSEVSNRLQVNYDTIERNIRTIIKHSWTRGGKEELEKISNGTLYQSPSVGEIIEILACYLIDHPNDI